MFFHIGILLLIFNILFVNQAQSLVPFQKITFALRATVTQLKTKSTLSLLSSQSHEKYSYDQKRAVISYALFRRQIDVGQLFYSSNERESLKYDHQDKSCKLVDELNLLPNLNVGSLKLDDSTDLDHVIGLARLLLFVEHHKDRLKLVGEPLEKRNMIALEYTYSFDDVQLNIYYSGTALTQDPNALPMQIIVTAKQQTYIVDYSRLSSFSSIEQEVSNPDGTYIDQFAFPRECGAELRNKWAHQLIEMDKFDKFSFQARITSGNTTGLIMPKISYNNNMELLSLSYGSRKVNSYWAKVNNVVTFRSQRAYQVIENAASGKQTERRCYVFKTASLDEQRRTASEILTGAYFFIYLGLAEVRGSSVRLYIASDSIIPLWMEQPLEYSSNGSTKVRDPLMGMDSTKMPLTTLIYVAIDDRVVQMELIKPNSRVVIELFNFKWDLDPVESKSDLFSLHLACSNTNGTKHSQLKMSLGKLDDQNFKVVPERYKLELSLLNMIQEKLSIPVTMVYDLEAKLIAKKDFFVSFRVASHTKNIESLTYLGKGEMKNKQKARLTVITNSFQTCFQLATKEKTKKILFGYNNRNKKCVIISSVDDIELKKGEQLELIEFYEAEHDQTSVIMVGKEVMNGRWLEDSNREIYRQRLVGSKVTLDIPGAREPFSRFQIKRLQVESLDEREVGLPDMIKGYGLLEEHRHFEGSKSQMTLAECRSGCLASDSCQSYSVCQRFHSPECILSPFNFQSDVVMRQLESGRNDRFLNITLDGGKQVKLLRHPNCNLYNKLYMNLFYKAGTSTQTLGLKQKLVAMKTPKGEEDCAKICVQLNLRVLAQKALLSSKINPLLSSKMSPELKKELENLLAQDKENSEKLCTGFLYLEPSQVDNEETLATKFKINLETLRSFSGYCSLEVNQSLESDAIKNPQAIIDDVKFTYIRYRFNLVHFYTAQKGVHLFLSDLSMEERKAYQLVRRHNSQLTEANYRSLSSSLASILNKNLQEVFVKDERDCASLCFLAEFERLQGPWPMCKSFDVSYDDRLKLKICYLNSISLEEVVKNEWTSLVNDQTDNSPWVEWLHYEPSFLLAHHIETLSEAKLELEESKAMLHSHIIINGFFLFILSWLSILVGLFLGVKTGQSILLNHNSKELEREGLTKFDFANQVNEQGVIVD